MKKHLLTTLLLLTPCICLAQTEDGENVIVDEVGWFSFAAPDYEGIKRAIADSTSEYYYPRLLQRFSKADTTLAEDINTMRCIYYGYVFQPDYSPYRSLDEQEEIQSILFGDEEPTQKDFLRVIELADQAIVKKPTELPMYYYRLIGCAYGLGEDDPRTAEARFRLDMLFNAIYSTGNGSREAPFHLSSTMHSYFIMSIIDLRPDHQELQFINGRGCDAFPLEENELGLDTLFFDIHECMGYWGNAFSSADEEATDDEAGTQLTIDLGSHFIIKLDEGLDEEATEFKVVKMEPFDTVLPSYHNTGLFADEGEANTIEGYFCLANFGSTVKAVLILKSWIEEMVEYDTQIHSEHGGWEDTSNSGIYYKAEMSEIWSTGYDKLRISSLHKAK